MKYKLVDVVVLTKDIDKYNLQKGDLGTIVEIYGSYDYEVEFVTAGGDTHALISLNENDIRPIERRDMVSVRHLQEVA